MVSKLSAAGVIETLRGTGGGLRLARPPATINLADIIEAVEGPIAMTTCLEQGRAECCIEENCRVKPHWGIVNDAVRRSEEQTSELQSLMRISYAVFCLEKKDKITKQKKML